MPNKKISSSDPYRLETVSRACEILKCFHAADEWLKLKEIVRRTGMDKTIAFRLIYTLTEHGLLERSTVYGCRTRTTIAGAHRVRIGYAAQGDDTPFSAAVTAGLRLAAARENIELIVVDNRWSPTAAVNNAVQLIKDRVNLAVVFNTYEKVAPRIAAMFREAQIPLIAVEVPHPGAVFYGADNYRIGSLAGRVLARWAKQHWGADVEHLLLIDFDGAGPVPQLRTVGAEAAIRDALPHLQAKVIRLQAKGDDLSGAFDAVHRYLRQVPAKRTLVTGINDAVVLGALRAFEEAGRSSQCAGVGLGGIPEALFELRRKNSRVIGLIAFFPDRYGTDIIRLALDILQKKRVPPAVYASHALVTLENVDRMFPASLLVESA